MIFMYETNVYFLALFAAIPLLWLLISLGYFKLPGIKAIPIGLILSIWIAVKIFGYSSQNTLASLAAGIKYALFPILWVIIAAIYTYNISLQTGAIEKIKLMLTSVSDDHRVLTLILAFSFGGFLEAAAGFGTAVAIPAGILIALGCEPILAAVVCLIANSVPVAFGALGIPVLALQKVTNLPLNALTTDIALQLSPFAAILPFVIIIVITKSIKGLKGIFGVALISGLSFTAAQTLTAIFLGPALPAVLGSIISLITTIIYVTFFPIVNRWSFRSLKNTKKEVQVSLEQGLRSWSPYILLLVLIVLVQVAGLSGENIKKASFSVQFITSPGTLMLLSAIIGGWIQGGRPLQLIKIYQNTLAQLSKTFIIILSIVSMATLLKESHMVSPIAVVFGQLTGPFYPFISPLIGTIGTFVTGSDTSANLLFGSIQSQTAAQIGASEMNKIWITASNTSGATAGKMISPQSLAIAASATGLVGKEGTILAKTMKFCLGYVAILGISVYIISLFL